MSKKKDSKNTSSGRDKYTNTIQTETYRQQMAVKILTRNIKHNIFFNRQKKGF